jgi:hypothetical protein
MNGRSSWAVSSGLFLHLICSFLLSRISLCVAFCFLFTRAGSLITVVLRLSTLGHCLSDFLYTEATTLPHDYSIRQRRRDALSFFAFRCCSWSMAAAARSQGRDNHKHTPYARYQDRHQRSQYHICCSYGQLNFVHGIPSSYLDDETRAPASIADTAPRVTGRRAQYYAHQGHSDSSSS